MGSTKKIPREPEPLSSKGHGMEFCFITGSWGSSCYKKSAGIRGCQDACTPGRGTGRREGRPPDGRSVSMGVY